MPTSTNYAELGAVPLLPGTDESRLWRATLLGPSPAPTFLFREEPEHRAIETLMASFGAASVSIVPPDATSVESAADAAERLLAVARGLPADKAMDPEALATLVSAAVAYGSASRLEATR